MGGFPQRGYDCDFSDFRFLVDLDSRLRSTKPVTINAGRYNARTVQMDEYNRDEVITLEELERIEGLLNERDYALVPINTNMGLSAGFAVVMIDTPFPDEYDPKGLLKFLDKQLPDGVSWDRMAESYMGERNRELLRLAGFDEPTPNRAVYDY